jgi:hypothetical protein
MRQWTDLSCFCPATVLDLFFGHFLMPFGLLLSFLLPAGQRNLRCCAPCTRDRLYILAANVQNLFKFEHILVPQFFHSELAVIDPSPAVACRLSHVRCRRQESARRLS